MAPNKAVAAADAILQDAGLATYSDFVGATEALLKAIKAIGGLKCQKIRMPDAKDGVVQVVAQEDVKAILMQMHRDLAFFTEGKK